MHISGLMESDEASEFGVEISKQHLNFYLFIYLFLYKKGQTPFLFDFIAYFSLEIIPSYPYFEEIYFLKMEGRQRLRMFLKMVFKK